jgi:hypothetical protein
MAKGILWCCDHAAFKALALPNALTLSQETEDRTPYREGLILITDEHAMKNHTALIEKTLRESFLRLYFVCIGRCDETFLQNNKGSIRKAYILSTPLKFGVLLDLMERLQAPSTLNVDSSSFDIGNLGHVLRDERTIKTQNAPISITDKELLILYCLSLAQDNVVPRSLLYRFVWGYADDVETHTLETHIYRLRQKIESAPKNPKILVTEEHNAGYRLKSG